MNFENGDKVLILSNGKAYKGVHDGKIGTVVRDDIKTSKHNITVLIDKERNFNSQHGLWYINSKYLLKVKDVNTEDISNMMQSEVKTYAEHILGEYRKRFMQGYFNEITNLEREYDVKWSNNKKESKNMRTLGILDLWRENKENKENEMYLKEFDRVLFDDIHFKFLKDKTNEINAYLIENGFTKLNEVPRLKYISEETKTKIEALKKDREGHLADITALYNEVKTMLSACDTYEQEMDVLKAYKVVDVNGVLIKE